ncbi:MAG: transposase [Candidatus Poribacteria bacterium]|nr:transposase [Candidatus Poribacteria bacterium]
MAISLSIQSGAASGQTVAIMPKIEELKQLLLKHKGVFFMNLIEVMELFPDQEACIEHLERVRWAGTPVCPHCGVRSNARKRALKGV